MTKEIKKEKSDDVIIVKLSDDGDSVMRVEKDAVAQEFADEYKDEIEAQDGEMF